MLILFAILFIFNNALPCESYATLQQASLPDYIHCYLRRESIRRPQGGSCGINDFPTNFCTAAVLSPIRFDIDGTLDLPLDSDPDSLLKLSSLRDKAAAGFQIYLNFESDNFGEVISNSEKRLSLLQNVRDTLKNYDLDGADFFVNITSQHKDAYEQFLVDANKLLVKNDLDFIVSVLPYEEYVNNVYNVQLTSDNVLFVNLKTDLLYDSNSQFTISNDPLYPDAKLRYSMESSVNAWLDADINPRRLIASISLSGLSFITESLNDPSVGLTVIRQGYPGQFTQTPGTLAYYEICTDSSLNITTAEKYNYAVGVDGQRWVGFNNIGVAAQAGQLILAKRIRGGAVNDICSDDYDNRCGDGPFSLTVTFFNSYFYLVDVGAIGPRETTGTVFGSVAGPTSQMVFNQDAVVETEAAIFSV